MQRIYRLIYLYIFILSVSIVNVSIGWGNQNGSIKTGFDVWFANQCIKKLSISSLNKYKKCITIFMGYKRNTCLFFSLLLL